MSEPPLQLTERETRLIEYLRGDQSKEQSITAAWALLKYAVDLDSEIDRLQQEDGQDLSQLIKELRRKSSRLKALGQIISGS